MAGALAGVLGLCLLAAILLTGDGGRASEAAAPAMLTMPRLSAAASVDTEIGEQVSPWAGQWVSSFFLTVCWWWASHRWKQSGAPNTPGGIAA